MNTDKDIATFLFALSEAFPKQAAPARLEIYLKLLRERLVNADLQILTQKILEKDEFFPSCAQIIRMSGAPRIQTHRERATEFVDEMLLAMQTRSDYVDYAGPENMRFWREKIGVTKFDLNQLEPKFNRGHWIDIIERAYVEYEIQKLEKVGAIKSKQLGANNAV